MAQSYARHSCPTYISLLLPILILSLSSGCVISSVYTHEGEESLSKIELIVQHGVRVRVPIDNEVLSFVSCYAYSTQCKDIDMSENIMGERGVGIWNISTFLGNQSIRIELGSIWFVCHWGWGAKKTSRQPEDRRAQERRCKRILRGMIRIN